MRLPSLGLCSVVCLGVFIHVQKATIMSNCPSVHPLSAWNNSAPNERIFVWNNSAPNERIFVKFDI